MVKKIRVFGLVGYFIWSDWLEYAKLAMWPVRFLELIVITRLKYSLGKKPQCFKNILEDNVVKNMARSLGLVEL